MKKKRCRRHFCAVLTMMILIVGMCHDLTQADSILTYAQNVENTSVIRTVSDALSHQDAYIEEENRNEEFSYLRVRSRRGREEETSFDSVDMIAVPEDLPGKFLCYTKKTDVRDKADRRSAAVTIRYIHLQDGKKDRSSF